MIYFTLIFWTVLGICALIQHIRRLDERISKLEEKCDALRQIT